MLEDALGRPIDASPARRVVSLVPSETESVVALAGVGRLVGRTEYCEEPAGVVEAVPTVGGTKDVDVDAVIARAPDLVLANQEENTRRDVERLIDAGLRVHVSFPCTVDAAVAYLDVLARLLGVAAPPPASTAPASTATASIAAFDAGRPRVFVPIWRDPWMSFDRRTYASDLLRCAGLDNVLAERARRYPLAADVAGATPIDPGARDTRYPRLSVDEIRATAPRLVLLPDEPFRFDASHVEEVRGWGLDAEVRLVSGKDLFWYGVRTAPALAALRRLADQVRT